jgi:cyclophilin family peptidyl-prolyl cis-trans isomerase
MARTNVFNSATSEFFINAVDNTFLDYKMQPTQAMPCLAKWFKAWM